MELLTYLAAGISGLATVMVGIYSIVSIWFDDLT
jgi:hypothetical protein